MGPSSRTRCFQLFILFVFISTCKADSNNTHSYHSCDPSTLDRCLPTSILLELDPTGAVNWTEVKNSARVQCSENGTLTRVNLTSLSLSGKLPNSWPTYAPELRFLNVTINELHGTLPAAWSQWSNMEQLAVMFTDVSGTLPTEWSTMSQLTMLQLYANFMEGTIPQEWSAMSSLVHIDLGFNNLTGTLPPVLPSNLRLVAVKNNSITGTIPEQWTQSPLDVIDVGVNKLYGTLPKSYSLFTNASAMWFNNNLFTGTLPAEWSAWVNLQAMGVHYNKLEGTLPEEWSTLRELGAFDVANNMLTGTLPASYAHSYLNFYPVPYYDFSNNRFSGVLPETWNIMEGLGYVGLHGNDDLCTDRTCLDFISRNWTYLPFISVDGGQAVHPAWCSVASANSKTYVMYVGTTPAFDECMHGICISREPSRYLVGYLQTFHLDSAISSILMLDDKLLTRMVQEDTSTVLIEDSSAVIVKSSDEGWIVGDGSHNDPCVDVNRFRNMIISFSIFGLFLLLIVVDGILMHQFHIDVLIWCWPWFRILVGRQRFWWQPPLLIKRPNIYIAWLIDLGLAAWAMRYSFVIVLDITLDAILLVQIIPLTVGWLLLASFLAGMLVSGLAIHAFLAHYTAQTYPLEASTDTTKSAADAPFICHIYRKLSTQSQPVKLLAYLLLLPVLAVVVDLLVVCYFVVQLPATVLHTFAGNPSPDNSCFAQFHQAQLLGCLVPAKVFYMRSLVTVLFQSCASVAFTSWGYAVTRKYSVGKFITQTTFLLNLTTSMLHVLVQAWTLKELYVRYGSIMGSFAHVLNLGPQQIYATQSPAPP